MGSSWQRLLAAALLSLGVAVAAARAKDTRAELQRDLHDDAIVGEWNYDDINAAFARAAREKRPVCVVFR